MTSDHGTQGGSQGVNPWSKKNPYDASVHVPGFVRYPGVIEAGSTSNTMVSMVDWFPTLCDLAGVPVPRSVEGTSRADQLRGAETDPAESAFLMNFSRYFDWFEDGAEWRGVRTIRYTYARWLSGREELYDRDADPLQMNNVIDDPGYAEVLAGMREQLVAHQSARQDELVPCSDWKPWLDEQRRVIRNAFGELSHPESPPDWSLLH